MIELVLDAVTALFLLAGCILLLIGGFGLLRLPDAFARLHAAGMIDTLGLALILVGLMFQAGLTLVTVKLGLIAVFVLYTSPVVSHALARAALAGGFRPGARHVVLPDPSSPKSLPSGSGEGRAP
ncbi:MAG: monovalent cation/H(+) antiporter subunit G [Geminicoccaceae bacterium]|nr:monovalent cation/H(+) antiporter subunit G [Geminicoccaceae bacterium]